MAIRPTSLEEAANAYSDANDRLAEASAIFFEKIALYSAGIISLSMTFIGYLFSKDATVIQDKVWSVPLYSFAFLSWILLFLSLVLGLSVRFFFARYLSRQLHTEWLRFFSDDWDRALREGRTGELIRVQEADDIPANMRLINQGVIVGDLKKVLTRSRKSLDVYVKIGSFLRPVTISLFVFGCVAILFFVSLSILHVAS